MIYLPSIVSPDSSGAYHHPSHIPEASETVSPLPAGGSSTDVKKVDKPGEDDEVSSVTPTASPNPSSPNLNVPWAKPPRSPLSHRIKVDLNDVWHNENEDWARCHTALKSMKSDGRRLELWAAWLGDRGEEEEDITGLKRLSLERRRKEERRKEKRKASAESQKKSIEKGKKRGVQWTEDNIPTESTQKGSISHFISDEPLAVDGGTAPREAVARVLREHVSRTSCSQSIIADTFCRLKKFSPLSYTRTRAQDSTICSTDVDCWRVCLPGSPTLSRLISENVWRCDSSSLLSYFLLSFVPFTVPHSSCYFFFLGLDDHGVDLYTFTTT